jgi:hypothetical protein
VGNLQAEAEGDSRCPVGGTVCLVAGLQGKGGWVRAGRPAAALLLWARVPCGDGVPPLLGCPAALHTQ